MDLKKPRKNKTKLIRLTEEQANRIEGLAQMYAGGNVSLWIIYGSINAPRKFITKDVLLPKKKKRRRPK